MRTIIAGSRGTTKTQVYEAMRSCPWKHEIILSGRAKGADRAGEDWAYKNGLFVEPHPADWKEHGRIAGVVRNERMAQIADALVLVWDGKSPGSAHMLKAAKRHNLKIHEVKY